MNDADALEFARKHVDTWNSHDLEAIMALYSESVELVSPLAASLVGESTLRGHEALRDYFARGLQKYPALRFALINTFRCQSSVTLLFRGAGESRVGEHVSPLTPRVRRRDSCRQRIERHLRGDGWQEASRYPLPGLSSRSPAPP